MKMHSLQKLTVQYSPNKEYISYDASMEYGVFRLAIGYLLYQMEANEGDMEEILKIKEEFENGERQ